MKADFTGCEIDTTKVNTNKTFDCPMSFKSIDNELCYSGNEAGVKFGFDADGQGPCSAQLKRYDVEVVSDKDPTIRFKTKLDPGAQSVGVKDLPPTYMDTDLTFYVNPIFKDGSLVLDTPKVIKVSKAKVTNSCSSKGITPLEAYYYWNENDNLLWGHWDHYCGKAGNNMEFIVRDSSVQGAHLWSSGRQPNCQSRDQVMTRKASAGYYCYDRAWPKAGRDPEYKTGEEIWKQIGPAFNVGANCFAGDYDGSFWKNDGKGPPRKSSL
jgi:hypothetical protein